MYTRHTGINIPKNYSGSRFSKNEDTLPVKEHRPTYTEAVRSTHSPSYDEEISKIAEEADKEIPEPISEVTYEEKEEKSLHTSTEYEKKTDTLLPFSLPIKEILNGIDKEELLLIGLILLIASEKDNDNNVILTLLSLLLLYK
jgi:hypothetical protein